MINDAAAQITAAIDAAEHIADPLDGLAEKVAADPGAPFAPEVLERLCKLKRKDRAAFEVLRAQLKKAGCRVTALDDTIAKETGGAGGRGPSQADILIGLTADAGLFHTPDGTGYADLEIGRHRETWPIRSMGFKDWLVHKYYCETGRAPSNEAFQSARGAIQARARFDNSKWKFTSELADMMASSISISPTMPGARSR